MNFYLKNSIEYINKMSKNEFSGHYTENNMEYMHKIL